MGAQDHQPVLGLDIGGTKLAAGVLVPGGEVTGYTQCPTPPDRESDNVLAALFDIGRQAIAVSGLEVAGVGIACGGPLDQHSGVVFSPPHLPLWDGVPVSDLTAEFFKVPAVLENDATCGAIAEYTYGAGLTRYASSLLYLTISTGVGGGFISNGEIFRGAAGNGGEPGHMTVVRGGRSCLCGHRRGCLEAYCSGTAIAERTREHLRQGRSSSLEEEKITAEKVFHAAQAGDALATEVWTETVELLAQGLTSLVNILEPDVVVIGGGVARSGQALLGPVSRIVAQEAMGPAAEAVFISPAELGDRVCVVGAGLVAVATFKEATR